MNIGLREKFGGYLELIRGKTENTEFKLFGGDVHLHIHLSLSPSGREKET